MFMRLKASKSFDSSVVCLPFEVKRDVERIADGQLLTLGTDPHDLAHVPVGHNHTIRRLARAIPTVKVHVCQSHLRTPGDDKDGPVLPGLSANSPDAAVVRDVPLSVSDRDVVFQQVILCVTVVRLVGRQHQVSQGAVLRTLGLILARESNAFHRSDRETMRTNFGCKQRITIVEALNAQFERIEHVDQVE